MAKLAANTRFKLNDGNSIPCLGFGVYQSPPGTKTVKSVLEALHVGYRHIDTAAIYGNEDDVGLGVRESGIPRKDIFVTTKLWNSQQGYDGALKAFDESLKRLNLDYVDLYLIHWPVQNKREESWKALIEIKKEGRAKSIGVSNFTMGHLKDFLSKFEVKPAVNQVEFSPFLYQKDLLEFCEKNGIHIEAYSPLTKGERLTTRILVDIGAKHSKTSAQVLLRWALQRGTVPLPKSNTPSRIKENFDVFDFELTNAEMNSLDKLNETFRTSWDPTNTP